MVWSMPQFSLNPIHGLLSNFGSCFPWAIRLDVFLISPPIFFFFFFLIFYEYFLFSLKWDPMEATISKNYSSYKLHPKAFKLFLNFLPNGSHKTAFGIFENWNFNDFFLFSLTWDPVGVKNSSYKSQPKAFKLFLNFLPNGPHKTVFGIFEILKIEILMNFFRFP